MFLCIVIKTKTLTIKQGADPGFQVREAGALKKFAPSKGGGKIFGVFV